MIANDYPAAVMWNYGYQCNMNCLHCYSRAEAATGESVNMTIEQATYIAREIIRARPIHVHFGGGEPLMREDFVPVAKLLTGVGINVSLSTNGTFLDVRMARHLAAIPVDRVALSFHGIDATVHDAFTRHAGSFAGLLEASANVLRAGVRIKLVYSLNALTRDAAPSVYALAESLGILSIQFAPVKIVGNAAANLRDLQMTPDEWRALYDTLQAEGARHLNIDTHYGFDNNPVIADIVGKDILPCPCGRYSITVKPNGDVSPCNVVPTVVGNVFQRPLLDIWRHVPELLAIRSGTASPCAYLQS